MGVKRTPPFPNYPAWSTARFWGFIRSGLREKFNRYPVKYQALKEAATEVPWLDEDGDQLHFKSGKRKGEAKTYKEYTCAKCLNPYRQKDVQVDHITPAGSLRELDDLPGFVDRLFCASDGLQIMCTDCHHIKTQEDRAK